MSDTFEYRHKPKRPVVWLAAAMAVAIAVMVVALDLQQLIWLSVLFIAITVGWLMPRRPVYGIKLDGDHLTLAAWRKPRPVPLDRIAYLQAAETSDEISYVIVYRDGEQEGVFPLDLPDDDTLVEVMAERGIPVRGPL
ncbi:hypothetical protein [Yoonia litorea]|uniref:PH domain-containing protein n=1 Tax=Yoonia litorea TaxID=1123755 RepID=A0A1I6MJM2_9RHOB|nr:hypothetical protein [Yoonia litorea]SFS15874.1 hypothetical protein SAMN05444714_1920 [Yoonia litorea]